ncbi:unnamed protein product, partial [Effrenium voratum]
MGAWLFLAAAAAWSAASQDTTAPVLQIEDVQPFIFHVLVTVRLNEAGSVYCGAVKTLSSYTPSISQMKTGSSLDGHDSASVTANAYVNLAVGVLEPATLYDVFCYAEDLFVNGFTLSQIASTKNSIATASGGDYVAPTFSWVLPTSVSESNAVTVYFQLNEDGTVWCVAKEDAGLGTTTPTSGEILLNSNVDSWGTQTVEAALSHKASIKLDGLREGTTYDVYCFAEDTAGNFLDGTPAYAADPGMGKMVFCFFFFECWLVGWLVGRSVGWLVGCLPPIMEVGMRLPQKESSLQSTLLSAC